MQHITKGWINIQTSTLDYYFCLPFFVYIYICASFTFAHLQIRKFSQKNLYGCKTQSMAWGFSAHANVALMKNQAQSSRCKDTKNFFFFFFTISYPLKPQHSHSFIAIAKGIIFIFELLSVACWSLGCTGIDYLLCCLWIDPFKEKQKLGL